MSGFIGARGSPSPTADRNPAGPPGRTGYALRPRPVRVIPLWAVPSEGDRDPSSDTAGLRSVPLNAVSGNASRRLTAPTGGVRPAEVNAEIPRPAIAAAAIAPYTTFRRSARIVGGGACSRSISRMLRRVAQRCRSRVTATINRCSKSTKVFSGHRRCRSSSLATTAPGFSNNAAST